MYVYVGDAVAVSLAAIFVGRLKCVHSLALHQFSAINFLSIRVWGGGGYRDSISYLLLDRYTKRFLNCTDE
jgi:pyruvate/oxaloacetate carboxyltransferase